LISYALGWFNGVADGNSGDVDTADDDKDVAARLFTHPFRAAEAGYLRGLGLGLAGTWGQQEGALRPYVSGGQQRFFGYRTGLGTSPATANVSADGEHWRLTPQAYYYWGPFGVFGEYVISDQKLRRDDGARTFGHARNTAWQVAASYFLTGEENSWTPVTPRRPLNPGGGGWGAWEIAGRIGQLRVDDDVFPAFADPATSANRAASWAVGLNWHLNRNVKLNFDYEQTQFSGGQSPLLDQGEKAFFARAQVAW
jgi:phosphate-selective porin OprO/OprP